MKLLSALLLLLVPLLASSQILDCSDVYLQNPSRPSGVYTIYPIGSTSGVQVYCDMDSHGGKWTVFQRRMDGSVSFYRKWNDYKMGFGNPAGEYWLGLEKLHNLIRQKSYELVVDMEDFEGNKAYAHYTSFSVGPEWEGYPLYVAGFIDGGAGDTLTYLHFHKFATFDYYQHIGSENCPKHFLGAFWFGPACQYGNPNGVYTWGSEGTRYEVGVIWDSWKGSMYSLKAISMKIRPTE
ncbi:PREDICTED: microfibril-associated glycoprotein 4-like [Poecilia mexicana]|uniref:microfibril-associated glycoprotein 4-like n=1 Tax=Poecilia mexicana TaxID=48701 RepID=UPI00072E90D3|nr:PREDICTED: microfibril-associated glycoprotein 4-like [Poecilia mexicana]